MPTRYVRVIEPVEDRVVPAKRLQLLEQSGRFKVEPRGLGIELSMVKAQMCVDHDEPARGDGGLRCTSTAGERQEMRQCEQTSRLGILDEKSTARRLVFLCRHSYGSCFHKFPSIRLADGKRLTRHDLFRQFTQTAMLGGNAAGVGQVVVGDLATQRVLF